MMCHSLSLFDDDGFQSSWRQYRTPRISDFHSKDRYLAMSVFQKAIRRNQPELALSAGVFLRAVYPKQFWYRLQIIALEDVGLANLGLVSFVLETAKEPHLLGGHSDEEKLACFITEQLCRSTKDRSVDDLFDVVSRDPVCAINCTNLADTREIGVSVTDCVDDVFGRALSLIPPSQRNGVFPGRLLRADEWIFMMEQAEFAAPYAAVTIASQAARQTRSTLSPMLVALAPDFPSSFERTDDDLLPVLWHQGVPTWACGQHTRVGLAGLREYAKRSLRVADTLKSGKTGDVSTAKVLGGLLFRIECGQLLRRAKWGLGAELKSKATHLGWGLRDELVPDLLNTMTEEWELLNDCRLAALQNHLR